MHLPLTSIQPAPQLFQGREGDSAGERSFHSQFHSSLLAQNSRPTIRVWRPESETHSSAIFLQNCLPPLFVFKWPYETFPRGVNLRTSFLLKVPLLLLEMNRLTVIVGDEWLSWNNYDTLKEAQLKSCVLFPCAEQFWELYKQKMCRTEKDTHTLNLWHNTWRRTVSSRLQTACQRSWTVTHFCIISLCSAVITH